MGGGGLKSVWCLMRKKREMFMKTTTPKYNGHSNSNIPLTKKVYLHLKASVDKYVLGQGTMALLQLFEFS